MFEPLQTQKGQRAMMECMGMQGAGWVMAAVGFVWLLLAVAVILVIAALIKYLRT